MEVNSFTVPALRGGTTRKARPCSWETEGWRCESPDVCPDLHVGNFQHENDSTPEISSFHLKSVREGWALLRVCAAGGGKLGYLDTNPGYAVILLHDLEHLTSSL